MIPKIFQNLVHVTFVVKANVNASNAPNVCGILAPRTETPSLELNGRHVLKEIANTQLA